MPWIALASVAVAAAAVWFQTGSSIRNYPPMIGWVFRRRSNDDNNKNKPGSSIVSPQAHAVYVIGDLHGDAGCARYWINRTGLVVAVSKKSSDAAAAAAADDDYDDENDKDDSDNDNMQWTDPSSSLVFLGDYLDKGPESRWTAEYVKSLTDRFPGRVHALMGNHEIEALRDRTDAVFGGGTVGYFQLGYASVHPAEFLNFLEPDDVDEETDALVVEALYNASIEAYGQGLYRSTYMIPDEKEEGSILRLIPDNNNNNNDNNNNNNNVNLRSLVGERLKLYHKRYLDAFRTGTVLGTWLEQRPVAAVVGDTLFVHGGVRPEVGRLLRTVDDVRAINRQLAAHAQEGRLQHFLTETQPGRVVYSLLTYRGNHQEGACEWLPRILPESVHRLAVGHTPAASVRLSCGGGADDGDGDGDDDFTATPSFLALDSALSRWFRNSGNEYCSGLRPQVSSNGRFQCRQKSEQCQGQIVRILADGKVEILV